MNLQPAGRFAPSPSGPLHFGSLIAALASYLIARQTGAKWYLRIEDIDPPREVPGAADDILRTLDAFGFQWDGKIMYQSQRSKAYLHTISMLQEKELVYFCDCSRKILQQRNQGVYDGYCRERNLTAATDRALRVKFTHSIDKFYDQIFGMCHFEQAEYLQDFVIRRRDGYFAYQLAVVVDDIEQGITQVVRGADILESTPRQNLLYAHLQKKTPDYFHLPLAIDEHGKKLSKSRLSPAINSAMATAYLVKAFEHLGQTCEAESFRLSPAEFLDWAIGEFKCDKVGTDAIRYSSLEIDK